MLLGTFSVPPDALALKYTLQEIPDLTVETERVAAHSTEWVMPDLWMTNADKEPVTDALSNDPTVATIVEVQPFADQIFYHIEWTSEVEQRINAFVDKEGSILEAAVSDGDWQLRIRFASQEQLEDFRDHFASQGYTFQLADLTEPETPHQQYQPLTATQREALVTAMEQGYYQVPREITIQELAEELEITHQAVSELLRRGTENLIQAILATGQAN